MKVQELVNKCYSQAVKHGWWDGGDGCGKPGCNHASRSPLEIQALLDSEVSEFVEEVRDNKPAIYMNKERALDSEGRGPKDEGFVTYDAMPKPEGASVELVDYLIRLGDYFGFRGWSLAVAASVTTEDIVMQVDEKIADFFHFEKSLEFAAILHRFTSKFGEIAEEGGRDEDAADFLRFAFGAILWYFSYMGWDFEDTFKLKFIYNQRRPYRHGGKTA